MFKFTQVLLRISKNNVTTHNYIRFNNFSTAPTVELKNVVDNSDLNSKTSVKNTLKSRNGLVAAAFASLQTSSSSNEVETSLSDDRLLSASSVEELLSIAEGSGTSRSYALKVVSTLADWSVKGKVNLPEFETDPRFIKLCKILTKPNFIPKYSKHPYNRSEDLSTILGVTADDEAAKLVATITLPQMVKVMTTLSQKKRRSTMLLRALSYNITRNSDCLNLKECGDLLFSISVLSFHDDNLLQRITSDVLKGLKSNMKRSSVVGSILTSLGLLKYKDPGVLDALSEWMLQNQNLCRPQDMFALFLTLAVLNHEPPNAEQLYEFLLPQLTISDAVKSTEWLDMVWSLVLLNRASTEHISSVLSSEFCNTMEVNQLLSVPMKLKLININAAVENLIPDYVGHRLEPSSYIRNVEISRTKQKEEFSTAIVDTLKNLMSTPNLKSRINTGMGFYIDAELVMDKKCIPISLDNYSASTGDHIRIAIISYDYYDLCKGRVEPTGINNFITRLLEAKGYKVLVLPYWEFKPKDKLVNRVQYLETKLKALVQT